VKETESVFPKGRAIAMDLGIIAGILVTPSSVLQYAPRNLFNCGNSAILIIDTCATTATQLSAKTTRTILPITSYNAIATMASFIVGMPIRVLCRVL
jgi:hypothetical protein